MLLIPARTDTIYFHDYIYGKAEIRFVRGRLRFTDDEGNASDPAPFPSMVNRDIPAGGTFKVEACNNPYDVAPIWEDCTNAVIAGLAHVFKNKTNTAVQFGLNIRVTVERGDALTACWVSGIGGNFE